MCVLPTSKVYFCRSLSESFVDAFRQISLLQSTRHCGHGYTKCERLIRATPHDLSTVSTMTSLTGEEAQAAVGKITGHEPGNAQVNSIIYKQTHEYTQSETYAAPHIGRCVRQDIATPSKKNALLKHPFVSHLPLRSRSSRN